MTQKGLDSSQYGIWINTHDISIDTYTHLLYEQFVLGTPAYDLSKKGRDLLSFYHCDDIRDYEILYKDLSLDSLDCSFSETCEDLKREILQHSWLGFKDLPSDVAEAVYIYVGDYKDSTLYKAGFSHLPKIDNKLPNEQRAAEKQRRKKVACIDKMFAHLRNSMAHGRFNILDAEEDRYYIFQDEYHGLVSARMILRQRTLDQWIQVLKKMEFTTHEEAATLIS